MQFSDLITPTAVIDFSRLLTNIERMAARAESFGVGLRPHIKTHKCPRIATLQTGKGTNGILTSTIGETIAFVGSGFRDIIYATPITPDKVPAAVELSTKSKLRVLVDNEMILHHLERECKSKKQEIEVLIKIDCNYHRSGVNPNHPSSLELAKSIRDCNHIAYAGVLTHAGHAYNARSAEEVGAIAEEEQDAVLQFVEKLEGNDIESEIVSIGSTPTVMNTNGFKKGITEIGPGNYVFFDYTQVALESCSVNDCALSVFAKVVNSYSDRIIVDAGATALSKDNGPTHIYPDCGYGKVFSDYQMGELAEDTKITSLSQELGKIEIGPDSPLRGKRPGDYIRILPNHSCLVSNLFDKFFISSDETITDQWSINWDRFSTIL